MLKSSMHSRLSISRFCATTASLRKRVVVASRLAISIGSSSSLSSFFVATRCYHATSKDMNEPKNALVLGSSGALGSTVAQYLSRELKMCVIGADVCELPNESDWELDGFVTIPRFEQRPTLGEVTQKLVQGVDRMLGEDERLDVIICASGGWQADHKSPKEGASQKDVEQNAMEYGESIERMMNMNLYPVVAAGYCAQRYMAPEGLFVVIGATAALQPTPGMLGYGLSKTSAHFLVQTLGAITGKGVVNKAMRKEGRQLRQHGEHLDTLTAVGILPTMIDTPANRNANPKGNFDEWTKPKDIAKEIGTWIQTPPLRPHSGSLVKVSAASAYGNANNNNKGASFVLVR